MVPQAGPQPVPLTFQITSSGAFTLAENCRDDPASTRTLPDGEMLKLLHSCDE
jgi:hypothetical protein